MRDECAGKTKQRFLSISCVAEIVTIVANLCSFKITELFSLFYEGEEKPKRFY